MRFMQLFNGALHIVDEEAVVLERAAQSDIDFARSLLAPEIEDVSQHLAAVLQTDGMRVVADAALAFQSDGLDAAKKAAFLALGAMGKDVTKLGSDELEQLLVTLQPKLQPVSAPVVQTPAPTPVPPFVSTASSSEIISNGVPGSLGTGEASPPLTPPPEPVEPVAPVEPPPTPPPAPEPVVQPQATENEVVS